MMKKIFILALVVTIAGLTGAQTKVGTTAANFLSIPVGPRATGMGAAFTAVGSDVTSSYWNAGALSRATRNEFSASFSEWLVGTNFNWFGLVYKLDDNNAVAISINQLDYGDEEITTPEEPDGTGENWSAQDLAIGISYSKNLTDRFSIGGTVKYISQQIWNESASAFALDVGLLFNTQLEGLRLGMNIANFGTEMQLDGKDLLRPSDIDPNNAGNNANITSKLETDTWPLPLIFTVGWGYDVLKTDDWHLMLANDWVIPSNQATYSNVGGEVMWNNLISLRGGYNHILVFEDSEYIDNVEVGFSAGVGIQYDFGGFFVKFDYSYTDFGIFEEISRYSVSVGL